MGWGGARRSRRAAELDPWDSKAGGAREKGAYGGVKSRKREREVTGVAWLGTTLLFDRSD